MRGGHITLSAPITSRHSLYYIEIYNIQDRERKLFLINVILLGDQRGYFEKLEQEKFVGTVIDSSFLGEIFAILSRLKKKKCSAWFQKRQKSKLEMLASKLTSRCNRSVKNSDFRWNSSSYTVSSIRNFTNVTMLQITLQIFSIYTYFMETEVNFQNTFHRLEKFQ